MSDVIPEVARIPEPLYQQIAGLVPIPCVDLVIVRRGEREPEVLLIKRAIPPEKEKWCIIGGRVIGGREVQPERLSGAIRRQADRELGIEVSVLPPWDEHHPLVVFDDPDCDPAKYPIVMVYPVEVVRGDVRTGPESSEVRWFPYSRLPDEMGFTHRQEVEAVMSELSRRGWYPATVRNPDRRPRPSDAS
jgi:ADP-ribose pyrophosphatase YjhB (NUDIX family)